MKTLRAFAILHALLLTTALAVEARVAPSPETVESILARIKAPEFPSRDFVITDYGASADADCTEAIRKAIAACHDAGGGRVVVPAGVFRTGAVHLKSNVNLHVAEGATLKFDPDPAKYPIVFTRWEGVECMNYSPLIYAYEQDNVAVTGKGTLDGSATTKTWLKWNASKPAMQTPARNKLFQMAEDNAPVEQRVFGDGSYLRPNFIQIYKGRNVLIEGVTLINSPMWEIHPVLCTNVTVRGVIVNSLGRNNDGCDPESCRDVLIEDCTFATGDDCIAIKSGRNNDGRRIGAPAENIVIRRCTMKEGHGGLTIGSEISGGCRNVFVEQIKMDSPELNQALRFKSNAQRGGVIENVSIRDVEIGRVGNSAISIEFDYEEGAKGPHKPILRNLAIENVATQSCGQVLNIGSFPGAVIENIRLKNCTFRGVEKPDRIRGAEMPAMENVSIDLAGKSSDEAKSAKAPEIPTPPAGAQPVDVLPAREKDGAQSLNGDWSFKYVPALDAGADEGFHAPNFDVSAWKKIRVPGHWELQGFAEPEYGDDVKEGTGLYRRVFRAPKQWQGQRVFLRFDGVLYGFTAYVNGKPVGEWNSSFNASTFDITDALSGQDDNVLAVRVTTRSKGWNFDNMDCWALSGIYRDVTIFALPELHFKDYTARTTLQPDGSAKLDLDVVASGAAGVSGRLIAPDGKAAGEFRLALSADGHGATSMVVQKPQLWTAETPSLYRLEFALQSEGKTVQSFTDRIGLRQVTIEDGVLKLNGAPIKLRGVDHHEIWPEGRVSTDENTRRDLELIRDANINFIRTSHYPPHPRLLEMCDEMGLYVLDEVPFIHGRQHLKDPQYLDTLCMRARATVMRDKNRPCVLFWSLGNENPINPSGNAAGKYVKELDPTRPIMFPTIGSYFAENYQKMADFQDIYAPHYPALRKAREHAETLQKPIIFTEYAHQRGLSRGGVGVQDMWELFYKAPRIAGGAIWVFQDQGLLRTAADMKSVPDYDLMAWLDEHRYYDTRGFYGMDGLVYSDRTPQTDYWQVRKVYSPVQIKEQSLAIKPGAQSLSVQVENRHDFRSLSGMKLRWALQRNGASLQDGIVALGAKAKETETASANVTLPEKLSTDVFTLELRCLDEKGRQFYERSIRLDSGAADNARWSALQASLPKAEASLEVSDSMISVRHPSYRLKLDRQSGQLTLLGNDGSILVSAFGPHTGRNPTINDMGKDRERLPELWQGSLLRDATELKTDARQQPGGVELTVSGNYPRPDKPEESVSGEYKLLVTRSGAIEVSYEYALRNATGEMLEAGFAFAVPAAQSEFRWLGEGPYAGYAGKDRLNEYGLFHLNREDLYLPGNRRGVELASLANPSGAGFLISGSGMTLDLENLADATVLSHLSQVPGPKEGKGSGVDKNENVSISSRLKASSVKSIAGKFILLPLGADWPGPLTKWFGAPTERVEAKKPFLRGYDQ